MGYEISSPVKTIYLPLDYNWLQTIASDEPSITLFFELYKEKYGINLNDVIYSKGKINNKNNLYTNGIIKFYDPNKLIKNHQTIINFSTDDTSISLYCLLGSISGQGIDEAYGFYLRWNTGDDFNNADMFFYEV